MYGALRHLRVSELRLVMTRDCVHATAARLLANCRLNDTSVKSDRILGDITSLGAWRHTIRRQRHSLFWDVVRHRLVLTDVSGQPSRVKQSKKVVGLLDP